MSHNDVDLVFNIVLVDHGVLFVMIVHVGGGLAGMVVDKRPGLFVLAVVGNRMHQNGEARFLPGGDGDGRYAEHLRETMEIDLHTALFHDIHHVQCKNDRLAKLDELQRQVQVAFQTGSIDDVDDHIYFIAHNTFPGNSLFHSIGSQAVDTWQVNKLEFLPFVDRFPFFLLYRYAGPVGNLQVRPGKCVKEGGLPAVWIADKAYIDGLFHSSCTSVTSMWSAIRLPRANRVPRNLAVRDPFLSLFSIVMRDPSVSPSASRRRSN